MKLEQLVCSLELAKQLKALGVKQESLFAWRHNADGTHQVVHGIIGDTTASYEWASDIFVSAFTVAELGEMLPIKYISQRRPHGSIGTNEYQWHAGKYGENYLLSAETEADARAKMLIYLLENKLITL